MGITKQSLDRVNIYTFKGAKMMELGAQCLYTRQYNSTDGEKHWAKDYFTNKGIKHTSIDLVIDGAWSDGGRAEKADLRKPLKYKDFDIVTNFGTTEHVEGDRGSLYKAFKNIHNMCKVGGVMIHENPKTGNWQGHGVHYMTTGFYGGLCSITGYELLELKEEAAMGNTKSGWNVCAVLRKTSNEFCSKEDFIKLDYHSA